MLAEVRRWRVEAFESTRKESAEARLARVQGEAQRLNLPMLDPNAAAPSQNGEVRGSVYPPPDS
jgi:hypothetical protein